MTFLFAPKFYKINKTAFKDKQLTLYILKKTEKIKVIAACEGSFSH